MYIYMNMYIYIYIYIYKIVALPPETPAEFCPRSQAAITIT